MEQETKKKKSGLRKAMLPALAMLVASVLSLTTMTYAWFTSGTTADVGDFDLTIAAGSGLEIAAEVGQANTTSWKSTLKVSDITALDDYVKSDNPNTLSPVSTDGGYNASSASSVSDLKLNFFTAEVASADPGANLKSAEEATGNEYLSFPLYFRNAGTESMDISLGATTVGTPSGDHNGESNYGQWAVRMAFVAFGTCDAHASEYTINRSAELTTGTAKIFEPNPTNHTSAGIEDYKAGMGVEEATGKFEYWALKAAYSDPGDGITRYDKTNTNSTYYTKMDKENSGTYTYGTDETYFTLEPGTVTAVKVFIWIEGQDADCTNFIASNAFSTHLQFTVKKA